jgi:hypothetical protein
LGLFTARDFKYPPKNPIPATPGIDVLDDASNNNDGQNVIKNGRLHESEATTDISTDTQGANGGSSSDYVQQTNNVWSTKPRSNGTSKAGTSKTVNFNLSECKNDI